MSTINRRSNGPLESGEFSDTTSKMNLAEVFTYRDGSCLNESKLFMAHFNYIPNYIIEKDIDCEAASAWFQDHFRGKIREEYFNKHRWGKNIDSQIANQFFFIYDDLLVSFDFWNFHVRFFFKKTDQVMVERLVGTIKNFKNCPDRGPEICLLVHHPHGIELESIQIAEPNLDIDDNYNDDFSDIEKLITHRLSKDNDKGLVLLHGKPGTGKTSYIRYLVNTIKKKVIFLSPNMAGAITDPNLISVLIQNTNSILVIEDAENIIVDRNNDGNSPVSVLLNLTDGLLADCLHIQIVCSFNTDLSKIDSALLRKGRLIAKYEFKELETNKAQALSDRLGFTSVIKQPTTLSELYNQEDLDFDGFNTINPIGFRGSFYVNH